MAAAADIAHEYYLAATLDRAAQRVLVMGSAEGGVEIEEVAAHRPEAILRVYAHPHLGLLDFQARQLAFGLGLGGPHLRAATSIAKALVACLVANDADLVEVNPLGLVRTTVRPVRCSRRSSAWTRRSPSMTRPWPAIPASRRCATSDEEDPTDARARAEDINFIKLDGDIGCIVNGAGLAMTTMDLVKLYGGAPANFLDIGGGARADQVAAAMGLILDDPGVRAILVNIFGGITRGDEVARGLVEARAQQHREVPMVVRIVGTNAAEAAAILEAAAFQTAATLDEAAQKAVAAARTATAAGAGR